MIDDILDYLNQFIARDGTDDLERRWVAQQTHNAAVQALLPHLRTRDIRIVAAVGQHQPLPQKKVADASGDVASHGESGSFTVS
ncbi:hypothetical protein [Lacticaseibacillus thailandensis]|uniref:hypothetical protein n=1 Tax=Lacticaseibacillus thailandensis TaxID=381741 RepID=UPI0006CF3F22|nr:hypothetical protein [Lacticaseibacillus thailandensis]